MQKPQVVADVGITCTIATCPCLIWLDKLSLAAGRVRRGTIGVDGVVGKLLKDPYENLSSTNRGDNVRRLAGKNAIVTGAASGIGLAIAMELARHQCNLFLMDCDKDGLERVVRACRCLDVQVYGWPVDLADSAAIDRAVCRATEQLHEQIDILINNAGICYYGGSASMRPDQWERILAVNLAAPMQLTRQLLPWMLTQSRSHVVNVASMYGLFVTSKCTAYHATKFGLVGFSEALRAEFKRFGLGVTALCPGYVKTNLLTSMENQDARASKGPPRWLRCSPEIVARRTIHAIRWNRSQLVITPMARLCYWLKRLSPGLMAAIASMGKRKQFNTHLRQLKHDESMERRAA